MVETFRAYSQNLVLFPGLYLIAQDEELLIEVKISTNSVAFITN